MMIMTMIIIIITTTPPKKKQQPQNKNIIYLSIYLSIYAGGEVYRNGWMGVKREVTTTHYYHYGGDRCHVHKHHATLCHLYTSWRLTDDGEGDIPGEVLLGGDLTLVDASVPHLHVGDAQVPLGTLVRLRPEHLVAGVWVVHILSDGDGAHLVELLPHHLVGRRVGHSEWQKRVSELIVLAYNFPWTSQTGGKSPPSWQECFNPFTAGPVTFFYGLNDARKICKK